MFVHTLLQTGFVALSAQLMKCCDRCMSVVSPAWSVIRTSRKLLAGFSPNLAGMIPKDYQDENLKHRLV